MLTVTNRLKYIQGTAPIALPSFYFLLFHYVLKEKKLVHCLHFGARCSLLILHDGEKTNEFYS